MSAGIRSGYFTAAAALGMSVLMGQCSSVHAASASIFFQKPTLPKSQKHNADDQARAIKQGAPLMSTDQACGHFSTTSCNHGRNSRDPEEACITSTSHSNRGTVRVSMRTHTMHHEWEMFESQRKMPNASCCA
eukprot:1159778-Pelagomonas_calceolata.AAC.10